MSGNVQIGTPFGGSLYLSDPSDPSKSYFYNSPQYNAVEQYYADLGLAANQNRLLTERATADYQQWQLQKVSAMERGFTYHDAPVVPLLWVVTWNQQTATPSMLQNGLPAFVPDPAWKAEDYTLGLTDPNTMAPTLVKKNPDHAPASGMLAAEVAMAPSAASAAAPTIDAALIAQVVAILKAMKVTI